MRVKDKWRENLQEFDLLSRKVNVVHLNSAASFEHERKKVELALEIWRKGGHFITDGLLTGNRGQVDCCDLDEPVIHEVVKTEREESIAAKRLKYPFPIQVHIL